ncbi:aldo/keto reductase [Streptomyces sp. NPDC058611]|uniref:aldo/keto reductase n=1 Tax=unclassified Streptomyces TaxID=2593676 RepID=UPI00365920FA
MGTTPVPTVPVTGGAAMPMIGFGTWRLSGDDAYRAVLTALEAGYRHIDTAAGYGNHHQVGRALADSGIPRHEVFLTTKLLPNSAGRERQALERAVEQLGVRYVDLWLLHYPPRQDPLPAVWQAMAELSDEGTARTVGVSNYTTALIDALIRETGRTPAINQIPFSPARFHPQILVEHAERHVAVQGYSPLRHTDLNHPALTAPATRLGATPAQVVLAWHLARRVTTLPSSTRPDHIRDNLTATQLTLNADELHTIDTLDQHTATPSATPSP